MAMKKTDRKKIYNKFDGHCAYCGCDLKYKQMQVDHFWPQSLAHRQPNIDNNKFDNLMPSCQKCNIHKHGLTPEMWRSELALQVTRLRKNSQFDRALRFGQVKITECRIVFYFELFINPRADAFCKKCNMPGHWEFECPLRGC